MTISGFLSAFLSNAKVDGVQVDEESYSNASWLHGLARQGDEVAKNEAERAPFATDEARGRRLSIAMQFNDQALANALARPQISCGHDAYVGRRACTEASVAGTAGRCDKDN